MWGKKRMLLIFFVDFYAQLLSLFDMIGVGGVNAILGERRHYDLRTGSDTIGMAEELLVFHIDIWPEMVVSIMILSHGGEVSCFCDSVVEG